MFRPSQRLLRRATQGRTLSKEEQMRRRAIKFSQQVSYSLPSYLISFPRSGSNFLQHVLESSSGMLCHSLYGNTKCDPSEVLCFKSHAISLPYLTDEVNRLISTASRPNKFLLLQRDPRDVMISFYEFAQKRKDISIPQGEFLDRVAFHYVLSHGTRIQTWRRKVEIAPLSIADAYRRHVEQWFINIPPGLDCLTVRYESLVRTPHTEYGRIFRFLGLSCQLAEYAIQERVRQFSRNKRERGVAHGWTKCESIYGELISQVNDKLQTEIKALGYSDIRG